MKQKDNVHRNADTAQSTNWDLSNASGLSLWQAHSHTMTGYKTVISASIKIPAAVQNGLQAASIHPARQGFES